MTVNICQHAAIFGEDGTAWAVSSDWPGLTEYQHPLDQEDGTTRNVLVNEFKCALAVAGGNRQPCEAGVRMGNQKYMMTTHDPELNLAQLSCSQGGASIAKIGKGIVIGIWNKTETMKKDGADKGFQNSGDCAMQVETMASFLKEKGY